MPGDTIRLVGNLNEMNWRLEVGITPKWKSTIYPSLELLYLRQEQCKIRTYSHSSVLQESSAVEPR
jgi:hypothetical protein